MSNHHNEEGPYIRREGAKASHRGKFIILLIVFVVIAVWGIASRLSAENKLKNSTESNAIAAVSVMETKAGPDSEEVVLPGNVQAWHEAPIYARTAGYLKDWKVDIGARVKAGQLLAEIDAPDLDAQLHQAQADLKTSEANDALAQSTLKRWLLLLKTHSVSQQDVDDRAGTAAADHAQVAASRANLDRLEQLENFKSVVAPFDGVITVRNVDVGALVNAGAGTSSQQDLFHISETDKLRIYVAVPENYTAAIKPDMQAELYFPAYPGRPFTATLASTAEAINPTTRTLLIQLQVDNASDELMSGGYAETHIKLQASGANVILPVNVLLFRDGMQVAVVGDDNKVTLRNIAIGRDYGKSVEVLSGIKPGEKIVINPPDDLADGQEVRIVTPQDEKKPENGGIKDQKDDTESSTKGSAPEVESEKSSKATDKNGVEGTAKPGGAQNGGQQSGGPAGDNAPGDGNQSNDAKSNTGGSK